MDPDRKSPIVRTLYKIIKRLRSCTISFLVMRQFPKQKHDVFIERWVIGSFLLSIFLLTFSFQEHIRWWELGFVIIAVIRIAEIVIWVAWSLLFHGYSLDEAKDPGHLSGRRRIVILLVFNYLEFIIWFALIYRVLSPAINEPLLNDLLTALSFSFINNTGVGNTSIIPNHPLAKAITLIQSTIGVFMALTVLARFISLLPEPHEKK